ncbi:MAG: dTMP kinase [Proteobacteria bacterium]|nr:dTMP kinase [Pseudomonadota bacterium]
MDDAPVFPGDRKGLFITLEGVEGSGKTTQIPRLAEFLESRGLECVRTREPGGTAIGARLRAVLLDPASKGMDSLCELLLYEADRIQHAAEVILPNLSAGRAVVCDRFYDATTVYQGYARGLPLSRIQDLHGWLFSGLSPDLTLVFDLPAEVGLGRARARLSGHGVFCQTRFGEGRFGEGLVGEGWSEGRFETEKIQFHEKVRAGYLSLAQAEPSRFVVLDASGSLREVEVRMTAAVARFLDARNPLPKKAGE